MKHIIIGGVAGGATAAARIRRADEFAEIILLEKGEYISYANCGLPYYIGGVITERERLFVQTPESFGKLFNIDIRINSEAITINPEEKTVVIRRKDKSEYVETYDKLLLSPGASPVKPPLKGIDSKGIFTLRNVSDTDRIKDYIQNRNIKKAVIVGAGFIGLEMAENLHHEGIEVSIVEMGNQVMGPIDFSMAAQVHQHLLQKGIRLYLEKSVESFEENDKGVTVILKDGDKIPADMVILSIGVRPETALAEQAGLKIGETGGIWVDEYLQTSQKNIYAVGDAIEYPHPITGKPWLNFLATPANRQGRIVADNMALGNQIKYEGAIGTAIAKIFDLTVATTGLAAKRLKQMGIEYQSSITHSGSYAGYYPGAMPLTIKLTYDPVTGKLYGGQSVGYEGVDKRIDQIALVIKQKGTIYDLMKVEHSYAPPFSSAKDPVAIAGYAANNIISGSINVVNWREMQEAVDNKAFILDVRTKEEYKFGAIPGAINIPVEEIRERLSEIPVDTPVYIYCAAGLRGYLATTILTARGYKNVKNLSGGYKVYSVAVAPVINTREQNKVEKEERNQTDEKALKIDACGLHCPGPILKVKQGIDHIQENERIEITATDAGFARDAEAWCQTTGNTLISSNNDKGKYTLIIEKGKTEKKNKVKSGNKGKSFILFSDDLDKALATFILANGAAATGEKVSIFFTFWGLNAIKKKDKPKVKKDFLEKLFSFILPSSSAKLKLSKINMAGAGSRLIRYIMKKKGINSLEELRSQAQLQGVEFIACQMSMDVMGIKRKELLDTVTIGGVATYMDRADKSNVNLFI